MTAYAPLPEAADPAEMDPKPLDFFGYSAAPCRRYDGWTPDRQRIFLQALSEGASVSHATRVVGKSVQSAYALRRSARGAAFALGWQAAQLLAREALADNLLDRALHGTRYVTVLKDGSVREDVRHDNKLGMMMLGRLDRMADAARNEASHAAARMVAGEFEQFLDMIGNDAGPARTGLFLGARLVAEGAAPANADDLAPIRALARADRWLRTHTDIAAPLDTADLDPAQRATWTAEQWARAEEAGLLQLAPPPPETPREDPKLSQDTPDPAGDSDQPVWWDHQANDYRTAFPPPEDFLGYEDGDYGDDCYERALSEEEEAAIEYRDPADFAARLAADTAERDRFFGFTPAPCPRAASTEGEPPLSQDTQAAMERAFAALGLAPAAVEAPRADDADDESLDDADAPAMP